MTQEKTGWPVLIITDAWHPQINGVVRTYEHLAAALESLGHPVTVIGPCDFPHRMKMPGYAEIELTILPYRRLAKFFDAHPGASIHIGTEGPLGKAAQRICRRRGLSFTSFRHTHFPEYIAERVARVAPFLKKLTRQLAELAVKKFHNASNGIIVSTPSHAEKLRAQGYRSPVFCMPLGVPTDQFKPGPATLFQNVPRPLAIYVGRVAIEKNIEAFLKMPWQGSKLVVGDGPSLEDLKKKYPAVIFAGRQQGADLVAHYRAANVFVFPSRTDTFGIVLAEALACGIPVAGYNVMGPRDIVTQDFLGTVDDDLASAATSALNAPGDAAARHQYAVENYSWEAAARRFLEIEQQLSVVT